MRGALGSYRSPDQPPIGAAIHIDENGRYQLNDHGKRIYLVEPAPSRQDRDEDHHPLRARDGDLAQDLAQDRHPVLGLGGLAGVPGVPHGATFIDWSEFWNKDRRDADWLYEDVLARGRGHAIFAGHKVGKSLLTLYLVSELIRRPDVVVVYLDYEMGEDDLYDRLADMGHGPHSDLSRLRYALLPSLPPLDTTLGAEALFLTVDQVRNTQPDAHVVVVIDTTGRAVAGDENSADTFRAFYRCTGLGLKQRGITWARLDHAGKDAAKGQRGSSAKGDDVDVVWKLERTENGLALRRNASRMGWVPERVAFHLEQNPHLRFVKVAEDWPAGTKAIAMQLADLGVPTSAGERPAGKALRDANQKAGQYLVRAAQRYRRELEQEAQQ